jgi:hypothetical protein
MAWVILWVGLGLPLGLSVAATKAKSAATESVAAYLLEESLSVDTQHEAITDRDGRITQEAFDPFS